MSYRIPFGNLRIGEIARRRIAEALDSNWVTEGRIVREFEEKFAEKFGWKHAIMTSSGTMAGQVLWMAIRELSGLSWGRDSIVTPACAFVATANCLLAAGWRPRFADIDSSLNLSPETAREAVSSCGAKAVQFVMNMGRGVNAVECDMLMGTEFTIVDACEGHGGLIPYDGESKPISDCCDAAIYSCYTAHIVVSGEGGIICTDRDDIADLCRSIKSHGRPAGSNYFDFQRIGTNAKANELTAAIAFDSLNHFNETFERRREIRNKLLDRLSEFPLILFPDIDGELTAPHAFPILLADGNADIGPLYKHLETHGVECKTLWGALSNHKAFQWMGIPQGTFPVAERVGNTGLHFSCGEHVTNSDIEYITQAIREFFLDNENA